MKSQHEKEVHIQDSTATRKRIAMMKDSKKKKFRKASSDSSESSDESSGNESATRASYTSSLKASTRRKERKMKSQHEREVHIQDSTATRKRIAMVKDSKKKKSRKASSDSSESSDESSGNESVTRASFTSVHNKDSTTKKRKARKLYNENKDRVFDVASHVRNPTQRYSIKEFIIPSKLVANAVTQLQKPLEVGIADSLDCHVCLRIMRMFTAKWIGLPIDVMPMPTRETMVADGLHATVNLIENSKSYWKSFANPALYDATKGVIFSASAFFTALTKAQSEVDARDTIVLMLACLMYMLCKLNDERRKIEFEWASPSVATLIESLRCLCHAHRRVLPTEMLMKYLCFPRDLRTKDWTVVRFNEFCEEQKQRLPQLLDPTQQVGTSLEKDEKAWLARPFLLLCYVVWNLQLANFLMMQLIETISANHEGEVPEMYGVEEFIKRNRKTSIVNCGRASCDSSIFKSMKNILDNIKVNEENKTKKKKNDADNIKIPEGFEETAEWMKKCGALDRHADLSRTDNIVWTLKKDLQEERGPEDSETSEPQFHNKYAPVKRTFSDDDDNIDPYELEFTSAPAIPENAAVHRLPDATAAYRRPMEEKNSIFARFWPARYFLHRAQKKSKEGDDEDQAFGAREG